MQTQNSNLPTPERMANTMRNLDPELRASVQVRLAGLVADLRDAGRKHNETPEATIARTMEVLAQVRQLRAWLDA
jgi:hypothetical protein